MRYLFLTGAFLLLGVAMVLPPTGGAEAQETDQAADPVICEVDNCRVPLDRLANADTHPFRRGLQIIDASHPRWDQYRRAIRRYADARACLLRDERHSDTPDLLAFDWRGIGRGPPLHVCLFRVTASLNSIDAVENWLRLQGFIRITRFDLPHSNLVPDDAVQPTMFVSGQWRDERLYEVYPSLLYRLFDIALSRNFAVQIRFTEAGEVYSASSSSSGIFN